MRGVPRNASGAGASGKIGGKKSGFTVGLPERRPEQQPPSVATQEVVDRNGRTRLRMTVGMSDRQSLDALRRRMKDHDDLRRFRRDRRVGADATIAKRRADAKNRRDRVVAEAEKYRREHPSASQKTLEIDVAGVVKLDPERVRQDLNAARKESKVER